MGTQVFHSWVLVMSAAQDEVLPSVAAQAVALCIAAGAWVVSAAAGVEWVCEQLPLQLEASDYWHHVA